MVMTQILHQKISSLFLKTNLAKIKANVKKRLKPALFGADFLYDENIYHAEKKAQNSDVEWDRLHGEIEVVKLEIRNFCHFLQFLLKGF